MRDFAVVAIVFVILPVSFGINWDAFSVKTLYEWSHNTSTINRAHSENAVIDNLVCHAEYVNLVARHGARNPSDTSITAMTSLLTKLVNSKNPMKFQNLDNWTSQYDISKAGTLVVKGHEEQMGLGYRYGTLYRKLFSSGRTLEFASSNYKRTQNSAKDFYDGLMRTVPGIVPFVNNVNDTLIRFYRGCQRYETAVTNNATNFQQFTEFSNTREFQNVVKSIVQRLGLNTSLQPAELYTMYDFCSYSSSIYNDTTWCHLMTDAEREVLEYGIDIQQYYGNLYGNPMNAEVGCLLLSDILRGIQAAVDAWSSSTQPSTGYVVGKFEIGHVDTVGKLLATLGLFKDDQPLLATNMATMTNRKFRTSDVIPYSANVGFILYRCGTTNGKGPTFYVKVLVNEQAVALPSCGGKVECPYEFLKQAFAAQMKDCNRQMVCGSHTGAIVG